MYLSGFLDEFILVLQWRSSVMKSGGGGDFFQKSEKQKKKNNYK